MKTHTTLTSYKQHEVGSTTHTTAATDTHTHIYKLRHTQRCAVLYAYQPRSVLLRVDSFRNIVANAMKSNEATTKVARALHEQNEEEEVEVEMNDD